MDATSPSAGQALPLSAGSPHSSAKNPIAKTSQLLVDGAIFYWLIMMSGGIFPLLALGSASELDDATRAQLRFLLLPCLAMAPLMVMFRTRALLRLGANNPTFVLLLVWVALSVIWSFAPDVTGRRALGLTVNTIIACYLVIARDFDSILRLLSWCLFILLAASVAFILLRPELGAMPDGRGLRGAFVHKNLMGETIVLSLIVFFVALRRRVISRLLGLLGMGMALVLILPVGAASSIIAAMLVLALQGYILTDRLLFRQRMTLLAFALALVIFVFGLVFVNLDAFFGMFGRDATLTGRTEVWLYTLDMSAKQPWLGYGYASFWEVERFSLYVKERFQWAIPSAHNGYLEILLGLGWIGIFLTLAFFATMFYRLITQGSRLAAGIGVYVLSVLGFILVLNLVESNILGSSGLSWIALTIAVTLLTPNLQAIRQR